MAPVASFFETKSRDSGETFVSLKEGAPQWLQDAIYETHQGTLPNDWIYAECLAACEAIDAGDLNDDDDVFSHSFGRVDVYTRDLYQWAADMCLTPLWGHAEEDATESGLPDETERRIACIQLSAIRMISETMRLACESASEASEEVNAEG